MWFFCHGLDLYFTVNNPFSSYESRAWKYHVFTWGVALFITIFPYLSDTVHTVYGFWYISDSDSNASFPVCWLKIQAETYLGWPIFVLFFTPLAVVYIFCLMTVILAYFRLRKGLTQSFLPRVKLLVTSISNIVVLILFWGVAMMIYGMTYQLRNDKTASDRTFNILMFMIGSKAFSSLVVAINQVEYYKKDDSLSGIEGEDANAALREEVLSFATTGIKNTAISEATKGTTVFTRQPRLNNYRSTNNLVTPWFFFRLLFDHDGEGLRAVKDMLEKNKRTMHGTPAHGLSEEETRSLLSNNSVEDGSRLSQRSTLTTNPSTTLSPFQHPNNSFVHYPGPTLSTDGGQGQVRRSSASSMNRPSSSNGGSGLFRDHGHSEIRVGSETHSMGIKQSDMVDVDAIKSSSISENRSLGSRMFASLWQPIVSLFENDKVEFKELQPYYFQQIRKAYGVSKELYAEEFSKSIKQRMTEGGASGAFFFFSKTDKFVGKSCTEEEMEVLVQNAEAYSEYMTKHRNTFICKIYGVYELRIYNEVLYFFVMNNLFLNDDGLTMNEKYDLKGSWVARNSAPPRDGQTFSCTYCERKFVYRKKKRNTKRAPVLSVQRTNSNVSENVDDQSSTTSGADGRRSPMGLFSWMGSLLSSDGSNHGSGRVGSPSPAAQSPRAAAGRGPAAGSDSVELHDLSSDPGAVSALAFSDLKDDDRCPFTTGEHVPNVIMKDNDIKHKIRLTEYESTEVQSQLRLDADFLTSLGIMDYSLLVGVHLAEYEVEQASMEFCAEAPQSSPKGGDSSTKSLEDSSSGTSGLSRQRSFVRRASTMSHKRNVETAGGSGGGDAAPSLSPSPSSTSLSSKAAAAAETPSASVDLEVGGGMISAISISDNNSKTSSGGCTTTGGYKLTRKLAVGVLTSFCLHCPTR